MKYKHFLGLFFNHFIQPSCPTIAKVKSLHGVLRGQGKTNTKFPTAARSPRQTRLPA